MKLSAEWGSTPSGSRTEYDRLWHISRSGLRRARRAGVARSGTQCRFLRAVFTDALRVPPRLSADQVRTARRLYEQRDMTVAQIGDVLGVSRTTVYRALRRESKPVAGRRRKTSG
nr:helix-turn-helix domain-containing protein [Curtobacterium flaccumfaciens]